MCIRARGFVYKNVLFLIKVKFVFFTKVKYAYVL